MSRKDQIAKIAREIQLVATARQRETSYFEWAITCLEHALTNVSPAGEGAEIVAEGLRTVAQARADLPQMRAAEAQRLHTHLASHVRACTRCNGLEMLVTERQTIDMSQYRIDCTVIVCVGCGQTTFLSDAAELAKISGFHRFTAPTPPPYR